MIWLNSFLADETGATAIEYGLLAALIGIAGVVGFTSAGNVVISTYTDVVDRFCTAVGGNFSLTNTGENSCTF